MYDGSKMVRTKGHVTLSVKPEPPRPLARELPPADPFPIDALGPLLRDAVQAIHDKLQAPLAIGGQSVRRQRLPGRVWRPIPAICTGTPA